MSFNNSKNAIYFNKILALVVLNIKVLKMNVIANLLSYITTDLYLIDL